MLRLTTFITHVFSISCLVFGSGFSQPVVEPDIRPQILETFIKELAERNQFNGNILIAEKGKVIYERAIGMKSATAGDSLDLGSQFRLASACGPITALAAVHLQEAGKISYDDLVEKYIPEWPYKGATLRNLLNETSGFPNVKKLTDQYWRPDLKEDDTARLVDGNKPVIDLFIEHMPEPQALPGEAYNHNSVNYILLATIVERISGTPFHQFMRENIYLPAGMTSTHNFNPLREDVLTNRAFGIMPSMDGSKLVSRDFDYLQALDGFGVYSTLGDLFRLDHILYTDRLFSQVNIKVAFTPGILNNGERTNYGFGWRLSEEDVSADGYRAGFGVWISRDIEHQNTIIILTNRNLYLWSGVIQGIRRILDGEEYELPKLDGPSLVGQTLLLEGEEAARTLYEDFKHRPNEYDLGGVMGLQALAHFLSMEGYMTEALLVLRINTEQFPDVAWVWNWLGDGYLSVGDTTNAVATYQKALTIDTSLAPALETLQRLGKR